MPQRFKTTLLSKQDALGEEGTSTVRACRVNATYTSPPAFGKRISITRSWEQNDAATRCLSSTDTMPMPHLAVYKTNVPA